MTEEERKTYMKEYREKNREHDLEYHRAYRASHKEQVREANRRYWEKRVERLKAEADSNTTNQTEK